ncbi:GL20244 [Drosophila persimilis]|uniref:GL20244 n=1 Tax=Drosophila persimilis TaxID=7234 RepID=B4GXM6_DROPE|nr:protein ovarian tumor locus isoform X1 [Drosophila persimilis]EDW27503.1 GL20244 [Drosophila persimilis]
MESLLMEMVRPVTSGSRQAPDPFDQYLESHGMYRKHTARDASSLFRVIAEQMYDTQHLHYELRQECVRFMTRKRRIFEQYINGNFDKYCRELAKPKTYGTMLELRAMCLIYRRNVILYEPFNMGAGVTFNRHCVDNFRVFYTKENHFDSVFELEYMTSAAVCQSITFKMLYQSLFKLPDVDFAVESMLHPHTFQWDFFKVEFDPRGYMLRLRCSDGRLFKLDVPELTKCILEDFKLCKFHSSSISITEELSSGGGGAELGRDSTENDMLQMCPNRYVSCVRQLLDDGITPFPYKVAKSLDPNMYRNVEFDVWNDIRKESKRYNVYHNDYNFKVGAKCLVEFNLGKEVEDCTGYIQKINSKKNESIVFIEKLGKNILVPYETMHPVAPEDFRPWEVPYRHQQTMQGQIQRENITKFFNKNKLQKWRKTKSTDASTYFQPHAQQQREPRHSEHPRGNAYKSMIEIIQVESDPDGQQPQQQQKKTSMSKSDKREGDDRASKLQQTSSPKSQEPSSSGPAPPGVGAVAAAGTTHFVPYMPLMAGGGRSGLPPPPTAWSGSPIAVPEEAFRFSMPPPPPKNCVMMPFGGFAPSPQGTIALHPPLPFMPMAPPPHPNRTAPSLHPLSFEGQTRRSFISNGGDMPPDMETLRYFYNMGVDMHLRMSTFGTEPELNAVAGVEDPMGKLHLATTPPPTPDAGEQENGNTFPSNRSAGSTKSRGNRPEQLKDLNDTLAHAVSLLPTPTPSPSTNGRSFSFLTSSPVGPLPLSPTHLVTPAGPPLFFQTALPPSPLARGAAGGQNRYAWPLSPPMMSSTAAPPVFEVMNNFPNDGSPLQPKKQQQAATKPSPGKNQPADAYAATRHQ